MRGISGRPRARLEAPGQALLLEHHGHHGLAATLTTPACLSTAYVRLFDPSTSIFEMMVFSTPCTSRSLDFKGLALTYDTLSQQQSSTVLRIADEVGAAHKDHPVLAFDADRCPAENEERGLVVRKRKAAAGGKRHARNTSCTSMNLLTHCCPQLSAHSLSGRPGRLEKR